MNARQQRVGDDRRFQLVVVVGDERRPHAARPHGRRLHARSERERCERGFGDRDHGSGAAIVAHERDRLAAEKLVEPDERRRVGAREAVDRLGGIADNGEVGAAPEPGAEQHDLQGSGVLELVDETVAEPPSLLVGEGGVGGDRVGTAAEDVVEVEHAPFAFRVLVPGVVLGHGRR